MPQPPTQPQPPPRISLQDKAQQRQEEASAAGYEVPNANDAEPDYQQFVGLPPEAEGDLGEDAEYEQPADPNYERQCGRKGFSV